MTAPTSTAPLRTAFTTPFVAAAAEHDAIRETIGHHVDGLGEGSVEPLRRGFHPQALVCGQPGPTSTITPGQRLSDVVTAHPAPAVPDEPFDARGPSR